MKLLFKLIGTVLTLGIILIVVGLFMGVDINSLEDYLTDHESYGEQIEYVTQSDIDFISFDLGTRDVIFYLTDETNIQILYYAKESETWTITEDNGIFSVVQEQTPSSWFLFNFPTRTYQKVEVYVPKGLNLDLDIKTKTGVVKAEFNEVQDYGLVSLESNTGSITVINMNATKLTAKTDTGSVTIENVHVQEAMSLTSSTGSIVAKVISGTELTMKTNTGSARLENASITNQTKITVSTGSVTVLGSTSASYDLTSSTGDITFTVHNEVSYRYDLLVSTGSVRVLGDNQGKTHKTTSGDVSIVARTSTGSIKIIS